MLSSRPVIFISAVSKELHSARDLVAKTLLSLGYEPKWQDIAPTDTGDLLAVLQKWVDGSQAVIQIVGHRYGAAPRVPDPAFPDCSYTQYEAVYARQKGMPVWYILLDEHHPTDPAAPEPDALRQLQETYRIQVSSYGDIYHPSSNLDRTELIVRRIRDELALLRAEGLESQRQQDEALAAIHNQTSVLPELKAELLAAIRDLPRAVTEAQQADPQEEDATRTARAYASLEESLKLPPGTLAKELPAFAEMLLLRADTSEIDRANALFAAKNFSAAESAALRAKDRAIAGAGQPVKDAIAALILAGQSATEQIQYKRALDHYRTAAALVSEERDILEWADIQDEIGWLLYLDGQYNAQADLMQRVWLACEKAGQQESPVSLRAHLLWANALNSQGKYPEAEQEYRATLAIQERVLGPEHPETLASRMNLALARNSQGKHAEAEKEHRAVLAIKERVLGPEHPETLKSRNNLAFSLYSQGNYPEMEKENRTILSVQERVLGREHPHTLTSRMNLALALNSQGKSSKAEIEHRAVLAIRERVLGPEHPETLMSRMNLANALDDQGKSSEAEKEYRAILAIQDRVLGPAHPETLASRNNLASALYTQGKHGEAEKEHRDVLTIRERVLGPGHPEVFRSCFNLSLCLEVQEKKTEALELARRALAGRTKVLGEQHLDTKEAETLVDRLERK